MNYIKNSPNNVETICTTEEQQRKCTGTLRAMKSWSNLLGQKGVARVTVRKTAQSKENKVNEIID